MNIYKQIRNETQGKIMIKQTIIEHSNKIKVLAEQRKIGMLDFPFTMNMNIGCFYACNYCYLQRKNFSRNTKFGEEVKVKLWLPDKLDKVLTRLKDLPTHFKRVQINNSTEGFHPKVIKYLRDNHNRDIFEEIINVFRKHWDAGNRWMLHLVTKSNYITNYVDFLSDVRDMLQVELTIISADQELCRQLEDYAPSVNARLKVVKKLSDNDIFVRIMASPFMSTSSDKDQIHNELKALKDLTFDHGAKAFKNKGLNYFNSDDVRSGNARHVKRQTNVYYDDLIIQSGEDMTEAETMNLLMPRDEYKKNWARKDYLNRLEMKEVDVVNWGYSGMNNYDWGNNR